MSGRIDQVVEGGRTPVPASLSPARALVRTLLVAALVTSVVVALVRMTLPGVGHYREEVADWIGASLGQRVVIGSLEAGWHGWTPELWVGDVRLIGAGDEPTETRTLARFDQAKITIDPVATLTRGTLVPSELVVRGASLAISRDDSGRLRIAGLPSIESAAPGVGEDMANWLLEHGRLRLESTHIVWTSRGAAGAPITLRNVSMDVRRVDGGHHLDVSLSLPGQRSGALSVSARLAGDLREPTWTGTLSGVADDVDLRLTPGLEQLLGTHVAGGRARVRVQSTWVDGHPGDLDAHVELSDVLLGRERPLGIPVASARILASRADDAWQVGVEDLTLTSTSGVWPRTDLSLSVHPASAGTPARVDARLGFVRVEDVLALAGARLAQATPGWDSVFDAAPRGEIRDLEFSVERDAEGTRLRGAKGRFSALSTGSAIGAIPAFAGVSGALSADPDGGSVTLWEGALEGDVAGLLETPAHLGGLGGSVRWERVDGATRIVAEALTVANDDVVARIDGEGRWAPGDALPHVDTVIGIERADLGTLNRYLPHARLPKALSRWLRRALVAGELSDGQIHLAGDLGAFSFDSEEVTVEARGVVTGVHLDYAVGWTALENLGGTITLDGKAMHFETSGGEIFDSTVKAASVDIADVTRKPVIVKMVGDVAGTTQDAARYLRESPLGQRFKHFLDTVSASGPSNLALDLTIPAKRGLRREVRGVLSVRDNLVGLPGMSEGLQAVNGAFSFHGGQVTAKGVDATYLGRPITLSAGQLERRRATRLRVEGQADAAYLASHLHNTGLIPDPDPKAWVLTSRLDGETTWTAVIDVPHVVERGATRARIRVESDLRGVASSLPHPFEKATGDPDGIVVETRFEANGDRLMRIDYGSVARARLLLRPGLGRHRVHGGVLRLGGADVELPASEGIVIDGHLERLSLAEWLQLASSATKHDRTRGSLLDEVRAADINVRALEVAGMTFDDAVMTGTKTNRGGWVFDVEGPDASGRVSVPKTFRNSGIDASFERMVFRPDEEARRAAAPDAVDPKTLPPMRFSCRNCAYKDQPIGSINARTSPAREGLRIDSLDIGMPHASITATGTWSADGAVQSTYLDARGMTADIGAMIGAYTTDEPPTSGGELEVVLNASWPGSPGAFELARVEGILQLRAQDGRLMNIDPGAGGRFFQLLSVTSLPRRLRLDFSDLSEEGLGYKEAGGTFTIAKGNAFTEDFFIDSEVARIDIQGRTGLAAEDYDQIVTITPRLTSSLPLAPIWLAEKMFNAQIFNKVFASRYTVTGTWDDPNVEKVVIEGVQVEGER